MFKYYSIPLLDTAKLIFADKPTLKFSSAFNLNDPFELKFNFKIKLNDRKTKTLFFKSHPNSTQVDFENWKSQVNNNSLLYTEHQMRGELAKQITLSSFSEVNNSNLMWSHYTNSYQGVCVEYDDMIVNDIKKSSKFFASSHVSYSKNPPIIYNTDEGDVQLFKMLFNKQSEWSYEKEFRIVLLSKEDTDYLEISKTNIKSIILGENIDNAVSKHIVEYCKNNNIKLFYAITMSENYIVNIKEHQDNILYRKSFW